MVSENFFDICDRETEKGQAFLFHKKEPTKNAKIKTQKERYPILQKTQKERWKNASKNTWKNVRKNAWKKL